MGLDLLESWDLGYDKLSAVNPRLVYATNTGYGRFGQVNRPSFDMTVQALTGLMARLGEPDQPPIYLGMGSGDAYGGLMSALGIILALYHRNRTGKGQMLDASLYGAQLFLTAPTLQAYLATGNDKYAKQQSRKTAENPLWNLYRAKDKWVFLCVPNTDPDWARLCQSLEATEVLNDARFDSADKRRKNTKRLIAQLDKIIKRRKADEWMTRWTAAGITASPVQNLADLAADPQAWANNYFVETYCEEVQRQVKVRGLPIGLSKTPGVVRSLGPELGQDTEMVLTETLGYSWEDVGAFKEQGVIP
jgi:crotonobetainyl-CoA:carnitine CoA-transferase CaiB-like acyl-CoA transferase